MTNKEQNEAMMNIIIKMYGFESKTTIIFCTVAEQGDFLKTYKLFKKLGGGRHS